MKRNEPRSPSHRDWLRPSRSTLLLVAAIALLLAAAIWMVPTGGRATNGLSPAEMALIGQWALAEPEGPGTVRVLQFRPDHSGTSTDVLAKSNEVIQSVQLRWSFSGRTLLIDERSSWERLFGRSGEQTTWTVSVTDQELAFDQPDGQVLVYKRRDSTQRPRN